MRSLVRIAEDGEFYNIITSNVYGTLSFLIPAFFIATAYMISHGLLHDLGVALVALGCISTYFTLNAIYDIGGMARAAYRTAIL